MKRIALLTFCVASAASLSAATNYTWQNDAGGDLADVNNYNPQTRSQAGDAVRFALDASYRLTSTEDLSGIGNPTFAAGEIELALGDKAWTAHPSERFIVNNEKDVTLRLTSGVITNFYSCVVGSSANEEYHATFVIENPGTKFATGNDDLLIGSAGGHNAVIVTNGATLRSGRSLSIGNEGYAPNQPKCTHNRLLVTGSGTRFELQPRSNSGEFLVGNSTAFNEMTLDDGASCEQTGTLPKNLVIGKGGVASNNVVNVLNGSELRLGTSLYLAFSAGSRNNALIVSNDSKVVCTGVNVGLGNGCHSNRVEILDGSWFEHNSDAYIGRTDGTYNSLLVDASVTTNKAFDIRLGCGDGADYNSITVRNGGRMYTPRAFYSGYSGTASYNTMTFTGAGTLAKAFQNGLYVGAGVGGVSNVVRIADQARVEVVGVTVGNAAQAQDSLLAVESGATLDVRGGGLKVGAAGGAAHMEVAGGCVEQIVNAYVGYGASDCTFKLTDGGVFNCSHFYLGNAGRTNTTVLVAGAGTVLTNNKYDVTWQTGASNTVVRIADGALVDINRAVYLGNTDAEGALLSVDNATFNVRGNGANTSSLQIAAGATLELKGAATVNQTGTNQKLLSNPGSTIRFVSDRTSLGTINVQNIDAVTDVAVEIDASRLGNGGDFELVRAVGKINPSFTNNVSIVPATARLYPVMKSNGHDIEALRIKVPAKGLVLLVL